MNENRNDKLVVETAMGNYSDILILENILSEKVKNVYLIGEIDLSINEIDELSDLIKGIVSDDVERGTNFLRFKTPNCLAYFLVEKGIFDYSNGDFWSGVEDSISLSGPNWQIVWGDFFINYLKSKRLPFLEIEDAHKYVSNILFHGIIPNYCLDEYFSDVVLQLVGNELNIFSREEINFNLKYRRNNENERMLIKNKIDELKQIEFLIKEENIIETNAKILIHNNILARKSKVELEIIECDTQIKEMETYKKQYESDIKHFSEKDIDFLANSDFIDQSSDFLSNVGYNDEKLADIDYQIQTIENKFKQSAGHIFSKPWDSKYGEIVYNLPFIDLEKQIEEYNFLKRKAPSKNENLLKSISKYLLKLIHSITQSNQKQLHCTIDSIFVILKDIPVGKEKIEQPTELLANLYDIKEDYILYSDLQKFKNLINENKKKQIAEIKKVAEKIGIDNTKELASIVASMQHELNTARTSEKLAITAQQEIENMDYSFSECNDQKELLLKDMEQIDGLFAETIQDVEYSEESMRLHVIDELNISNDDLPISYTTVKTPNDECTQITKQICELKQSLEQYPKPFPYVDEPIRRFLLHGGAFAEDFLFQSVQMVKQVIENKTTFYCNTIDLPERIITIFKEWWTKYENEVLEKSDIRINGLNNFKNPVIYYDDFGDIMVRFPPQRFKAHTNAQEFYVEMTSDQSKSQIEMLSAYVFSKNVLETEQIEMHIDSPSDYFEFFLKADNDVINTYIVDGITPEYPFIIFDNESKKLITTNEVYNNNILIISHNKFKLEPEKSVIEKGELYGGWQEYVYRVIEMHDLSGLSLVDNVGNRFEIPISKRRKPKQVLKDGRILEGVFSNGLEVYIGKPPTIELDFKNDTDLDRWILSIDPHTEGSTSTQFYQLSELREILQINPDREKCIIPLSDEMLIGNFAIGQFIIHLRNSKLKISKQFSFLILPNLTVEFDKNIYLPCEKKASDVFLTISGINGMEFNPYTSSETIHQNNGTSIIKTSTLEHIVHGDLKYPVTSEKSISFPLDINIPRLVWRINGLEDTIYSSDSNEIVKIAYDLFEEHAGDDLLLIISMPSLIKGYCKLGLINSTQNYTTKLTNGTATFDLSRFYDTLRAGEDLQSFEITISDLIPPLKNVILFSVQKWQVLNIECEQKIANDAHVFEISWNEKGIANNRIICLWHLKDKPDCIHKVQIEGETNNVCFKLNETKVPPGRYLIHFTKDDPWMQQIFPGETSQNSKEMYVKIDDTKLLENASNELKAGNYVQAVILYKKAQEKNAILGNNIWAHVLMGFVYANKYQEAIKMSYQLLVDYAELNDTDCFLIVPPIEKIEKSSGTNMEKEREDIFDILILLTTIFDNNKKYKLSVLDISRKNLVPKFLTIIEQIESKKCVAYLRELFELKKYKQMLKVLNQMKNGENVS